MALASALPSDQRGANTGRGGQRGAVVPGLGADTAEVRDGLRLKPTELAVSPSVLARRGDAQHSQRGSSTEADKEPP